jgi:hypothetical protein
VRVTEKKSTESGLSNSDTFLRIKTEENVMLQKRREPTLQRECKRVTIYNGKTRTDQFFSMALSNSLFGLGLGVSPGDHHSAA